MQKDHEIIGSSDERVKKALEIAYDYGQIDGAHHRLWVIDQMVRALLGDDEYQKWVETYEMPEEDGEGYKWDCGIAP